MIYLEPEMHATMIPARAGPQVARNIRGKIRYFPLMTALYENPKPHVITNVMIKKAVTW